MSFLYLSPSFLIMPFGYFKLIQNVAYIFKVHMEDTKGCFKLTLYINALPTPIKAFLMLIRALDKTIGYA